MRRRVRCRPRASRSRRRPAGPCRRAASRSRRLPVVRCRRVASRSRRLPARRVHRVHPVVVPVVPVVAPVVVQVVPAATRRAPAARARVDAATRPSQNEQQQSQQAEHARAASQGSGRAFSDRSRPGYPGAVLPGGQLNPQFTLQLQSLARSGHKVQAIKLLRQATNTDLLTAKNYVDRL